MDTMDESISNNRKNERDEDGDSSADEAVHSLRFKKKKTESGSALETGSDLVSKKAKGSGLYLDTIQRYMLDFDFEKVCSVSLSNLNVYACLVCGKYFQGKENSILIAPTSHVYYLCLSVLGLRISPLTTFFSLVRSWQIVARLLPQSSREPSRLYQPPHFEGMRYRTVRLFKTAACWYAYNRLFLIFLVWDRSTCCLTRMRWRMPRWMTSRYGSCITTGRYWLARWIIDAHLDTDAEWHLFFFLPW